MPFHRFRAVATCAAVLIATVAGLAAETGFEWSPVRSLVEGRTLKASYGPDGTLDADPQFDPDGLLVFDGAQAVTFPEAEARKISAESFSVQARVRVDRPQARGCVVGFAQLGGESQNGWLLGYEGTRFRFALADGTTLAGATAAGEFLPGAWANLAAVFDGQTARLWVNGSLAASATFAGAFAPPKEGTPFVLGAFRDDDESHPIEGRVAFVKITEGLLPESEIAKGQPEPDESPFVVQPRVSFPRPASAVISWQSQHDEAVVFHGQGDTLAHKVACKGEDGRFAVALDGLLPKTVYKYRIGTGPEAARRYSPIHSFDTRHNLAPAPVPLLEGTPPELVEACDRILANAPDQGGYAVVLGLDEGRLAATLASRSRLHVVAADPDAATLAKVRKTLYAAGLLGHRVSVVQLSDPAALPWTDSFADLVLSERGDPTATPEECLRILRPRGGLAVVADPPRTAAWQEATARWINDGAFRVFRRGELAGAADWTHQYGTAGNASYTGEALGETSATSGLAVQWIGRPGGDFGIDRQPRMPAPLAANGRLFHQGLDRLVALNAFNGAALWSHEIPALRRLNVAHDCANWSADDEHLYVAVRDRLWMLDARSGELAHALELPAGEHATHDWGYVANEGEVVIGSAVRADSAFRDYWGAGSWFDKVGTPGGTAQVCSERLFGYRKTDAKALWSYGRGLVINSTIALHDGRLCFLENRGFTLPPEASGRVSDRRLWLGLTTVCLDAATGKVLWETPGPTPQHVTEERGFVQAAYGISTARGYLAVLSEGNLGEDGAYQKGGEFRVTLYEPDGARGWQTTSPWIDDHHGVHITHPAVTEDRLYLAPQIHDLATGQPLGLSYGPRRGCSTIVATKNALMFRILGEGNSPLGMWNKDTGSVSRFMQLRPSCWLNTLPAQGMLLVPEGGAGCSCGGWIETSVGFLPRAPATGPTSPETP